MKFSTASTILAAGHCSTVAAQQLTRTSQAGGGSASRVSRYTKRDVIKPIVESNNATRTKLKRPPNPATTNLDVGVLSQNEDDVDTAAANNNLDTGILSKNSNTGKVRPGRPTTKETNKRKSSVPNTAIKKKGGHNSIVKPRPEKRHFTGTNSNKPIAGGYSPINNIAKDATCDAGYVQCFNGYVYDENDEVIETCQEACGGKCCVGDSACDYFFGRVCKDDYSCNGVKACYSAAIYSVIDGCIGDGACYFASFEIGYIYEVHSSCKGFRACDGAADYGGFIEESVYKSCLGDYSCTYLANGYGRVRKIQNSCIEENSCFGAAFYEGYIEEIVNSCDGEFSCAFAAYGRNDTSYGYYGGGTIGSIEDSCNGYKSCMYAAELGGSIGDITDSCFGEYSCFALTYYYGKVGDVNDSCQQEVSCLNTAAGSGTIGYILRGCDGRSSCQYAAARSGTIDGIRDGCNNVNACYKAAYDGFTISPEINDCCNEFSQCYFVKSFEETDCDADRTPPPTSSPTGGKPTSSPTIDRPSKSSKAKSSKTTSKSSKARSHMHAEDLSLIEEANMKIDARTRAKSDKDSAESLVASANAKIDARTRAKADKGGGGGGGGGGSASAMISFSLPTTVPAVDYMNIDNIDEPTLSDEDAVMSFALN